MSVMYRPNRTYQVSLMFVCRIADGHKMSHNLYVLPHQNHGRRNRGVWGDNVPHFWDQRGTGGTGAVQWKWSLTADSLYSVLYKTTSDWISTPLTLVDTCQVNDIWKDGLGRISTVHVHALFISTCQHAHAAVNWLSLSMIHNTIHRPRPAFSLDMMQSMTYGCPLNIMLICSLR